MANPANPAAPPLQRTGTVELQEAVTGTGRGSGNPTTIARESGTSTGIVSQRAEARRRQLWEGERGAGTWRGFFLGPEDWSGLRSPSQEYSINGRYWHHLGRIIGIGLSDPVTAFLTGLIFVGVFMLVLITAGIVLTLAGTVSSTTLTYMRLLSPISAVRKAIDQPTVPPAVASALLGFQEEAGHAAKANLWWPAEPWVGVGAACDMKPPAAWTKAFKLPADLWACAPPHGYMAGLGVVGSWFAWVLLLLVLNSSIQALGAIVALRTRLAVTKHLHTKLFSGEVLYSTVVLNPALDNYDQRITDDLTTTINFGVGRIFSCLVVPVEQSLLQSVLVSVLNLLAAYVRIRSIEGALPSLFWVLAIGASVISFVAYMIPIDRVSRMLYTVKSFEGSLRWQHCRLMENSETVAMYGGEAREEAAADRAFGKVYSACAKVFLLGSVLAGLGVFFLSGIMPLLTHTLLYVGKIKASDVFIVWGNLNFGFSACFRIPQLYVQLAISGGPCHRVGCLLEALEAAPAPRASQSAQDGREPLLSSAGTEISGTPVSAPDTRNIELRNVYLAPPGAPDLILFQGLSMTIVPGASTAIVGPSGCGKSSLLRLLARLWPPVSGSVGVPNTRGGLLFLPQRSYVRLGTLGEQVTYPELFQADQMGKICGVLKSVGLGHLEKEFGLDTHVDWPTALGAGELQKLGFARLLFHRPAFALMDEATSAMDLQSEARVMQLCADAGITAVSVCHRPSAVGFHQQMLRYTAQSTGLDRDPSSWRVLEVPSEDRTDSTALVDVPLSPVMGGQPDNRVPTQSQAQEVFQGTLVSNLHRLWRLAAPRSRRWSTRCFRIIVTANIINAFFLVCGTSLSGVVLADISNLDETHGVYPARTAWCLAYFAVVPPLLFLVSFSSGFSGGMLGLHIRRCATDAGHLSYFGRGVPYAMNVRRQECLPGTPKWQPDQRLQQDMQMMGDQLCTSLFGGAAGGGCIGPGIQLLIGLLFACRLTWLVSAFVLALIAAFLALQAISMVPTVPATIRLQRAEGNFRVAHARVREFAESIVFHGGQATEAAVLNGLLFGEVRKRQYRVITASLGILMTANLVGFLLAVMPPMLVSMVVFYWGPDTAAGSQITPQTLGAAQTFFAAILTQTTGLTGSFATLGMLSGLTHRVGNFLKAASNASDYTLREQDSEHAVQSVGDKVVVKDLTISKPSDSRHEASTVLLVDQLTLQVEAGNGLLISGDSGCGKSSLMRVLAGLYPSSGGSASRPPSLTLSKSPDTSCMFIPQASYALGGSLRDEIAYPSVGPVDDERAMAALQAVGLGHLQRREGLGRSASWATELSGGELQRLGLSRVLYHRPAFAFLDDATSALDMATERKCLAALQAAGVTLVTASHRESLKAMHGQHLRLEGSRGGGRWKLEKLEQM